MPERIFKVLAMKGAIMANRKNLSEYRGMWLFVMFDLPVKTKANKRNYVHFRRELIKDGFTQLQYSIYARYFSCEDAAKSHRRKIKCFLPPQGQVRLLAVTDKQFGKMQIFLGKIPKSAEPPPQQLLLF